MGPCILTMLLYEEDTMKMIFITLFYPLFFSFCGFQWLSLVHILKSEICSSTCMFTCYVNFKYVDTLCYWLYVYLLCQVHTQGAMHDFFSNRKKMDTRVVEQP